MSLFSGKRNDDENTEAATSGAAPSPTPQAGSARRQPADQEGSSVANIGKSISIRGDLTGNEDMVIEGQVEGKVELPNNQLTIGANGKVKAEIHAKSVVVVGHVTGNVTGLERVEIHCLLGSIAILVAQRRRQLAPAQRTLLKPPFVGVARRASTRARVRAPMPIAPVELSAVGQ